MTRIVTTFAALGDPTRFAIVERLMTQGELPAGALLDIADISAPAISRHLKVLREAGLICQTVDKQRRIYSVKPDAVARIGEWAQSHEAYWNSGLDRLASALGEE